MNQYQHRYMKTDTSQNMDPDHLPEQTRSREQLRERVHAPEDAEQARAMSQQRSRQAVGNNQPASGDTAFDQDRDRIRDRIHMDEADQDMDYTQDRLRDRDREDIPDQDRDQIQDRLNQ